MNPTLASPFVLALRVLFAFMFPLDTIVTGVHRLSLHIFTAGSMGTARTHIGLYNEQPGKNG